jgi:hypothetical protein
MLERTQDELTSSSQVPCRDAAFMIQQRSRRTLEQNFATTVPTFRPEVDDPIRLSDHIEVMLDQNYCRGMIMLSTS